MSEQHRVFVGIDNGITGSVGVIKSGTSTFFRTPTKSEQSYTKKVKNITRVDVVRMEELFQEYVFEHNIDVWDIMVLLERPMVNPKMFTATMSAIRALEATIVFLEAHGVAFSYIDSKEWQRELLPQGVKGSPELKKASMDIGCRMFPMHRELIEKHKDADGMLMAEYCRRKFR